MFGAPTGYLFNWLSFQKNTKRGRTPLSCASHKGDCPPSGTMIVPLRGTMKKGFALFWSPFGGQS